VSFTFVFPTAVGYQSERGISAPIERLLESGTEFRKPRCATHRGNPHLAHNEAAIWIKMLEA